MRDLEDESHETYPAHLGALRGRRSTGGGLWRILTRPLTLAILAIAIAFFILPFAVRLYGRARGRGDLAMLAETDVG